MELHGGLHQRRSFFFRAGSTPQTRCINAPRPRNFHTHATRPERAPSTPAVKGQINWKQVAHRARSRQDPTSCSTLYVRHVDPSGGTAHRLRFSGLPLLNGRAPRRIGALSTRPNPAHPQTVREERHTCASVHELMELFAGCQFALACSRARTAAPVRERRLTQCPDYPRNPGCRMPPPPYQLSRPWSSG